MFIAKKKMIENTIDIKRFTQAIVKCSIAGVLYLMVQSSAWAVIDYCVGATTRMPGDPAEEIVIPIAGKDFYIGNEFSELVGGLYSLDSMNIFGNRGGAYCRRLVADNTPVTITWQGRIEHLTMPMGSPTQLGTSGISAYPTNVPGISVSFKLHNPLNSYSPGSYAATSYTCTHSSGCNISRSMGGVIINLHKTGDTPSGSYFIDASSFPKIAISSGTVEYPPLDHFLTLSFTGGINVVTRTCDVQDVTVELGEYEKAYFASKDATPWIDFNIELTNCPAFSGRFQRMTWDGLTNNLKEQFGQVKNNFSIKLNPTTPRVVIGAMDIVELDNTLGSARGVGVQLAHNGLGSLSVFYEVQADSIITSPGTVDGLSYSIPLKARYYRTGSAADVMGGHANTSVEFVINYK